MAVLKFKVPVKLPSASIFKYEMPAFDVTILQLARYIRIYAEWRSTCRLSYADVIEYLGCANHCLGVKLPACLSNVTFLDAMDM